jgi:hypothetical protein
MNQIARIARILPVVLAVIGANTVHAAITPRRNTVVLKNIDISNTPEVNAAEKRHKETGEALREAEKARDAVAIEAAKKAHVETGRALTAVRNKAQDKAEAQARAELRAQQNRRR